MGSDERETQFRRDASFPFRGVIFLAVALVVGIPLFFVRGSLERSKAPGVPTTRAPEVKIPYNAVWKARCSLDLHKNAPEALGHSQKAVEEEHSAGSYQVLGETYLRLGRMDEARRFLYLATITPGDPDSSDRARSIIETSFYE